VRPAILLLDEPFAALDKALRLDMQIELKRIQRNAGTTTILVTHDQEEALSLADSVAVLRDGRIVQQDDPASLYERPADEPLARFLGAVNVLRADFHDGTASTLLGALPLRAEERSPEMGAGAVMVRPEQLDVRPDEQDGGDDSGPVLHGRVEQCRYYGHDALLHIRPEHPDHTQLLLARVQGDSALPVGARVTVAAHGPVIPVQ
jgi:iron(III) transport system ATP-binding protein